MSEKRNAQLEWVNGVLREHYWRPSEWAKEAGVHHSTLSKFLSGETDTALTDKTVGKLAAALETGKVKVQTPKPALAGFSSPEAAPWVMPKQPSEQDNAIEQVITRTKSKMAFSMNAATLSAVGILPGDILIVDAKKTPKEGDVVCVQIYDRRGGANTAFRLFQPPFVMSAPLGTPPTKPLLVDNEQVAIRGTVISVIRDLL